MKHAKRTILGTGLLLAGLGATTVAFTPAEPAVAEESAAVSPTRLEVDVSERKLYVYHGGSLMNSFDVAVGEAEYPTPKGSFDIDRIIWDPAWVPPPNSEWAEDKEKKDPADPDNPMEAAKIFFKYPDYYIHGTDATHTLGQAESHGCIRMRPADVEQLAKFVQEHGGEERSEDWYRSVMEREAPKVEIHLDDSIPIDIHG